MLKTAKFKTGINSSLKRNIICVGQNSEHMLDAIVLEPVNQQHVLDHPESSLAVVFTRDTSTPVKTVVWK
jgi:hypothetical protein